MNKIRAAMICALVALASVPAGATLIDDFNSGAFTTCVGHLLSACPVTVDFDNPAATALGGNRFISANYTSGGIGTVDISVGGGTGTTNAFAHARANTRFYYAGNPAPSGLGGVNLTSGGATGLLIDYTSDMASSMDFLICSSPSNCGSVNVPLAITAVPTTLFIPYASLVAGSVSIASPQTVFLSFVAGGTGANLGLVEMVAFEVNGLETLTVTLDNFRTNGVPEPATLVLSGLGLLAVGIARRYKKA